MMWSDIGTLNQLGRDMLRLRWSHCAEGGSKSLGQHTLARNCCEVLSAYHAARERANSALAK